MRLDGTLIVSTGHIEPKEILLMKQIRAIKHITADSYNMTLEHDY